MPKSSTIEDLDDGGFIARSRNPLPAHVQSSSSAGGMPSSFQGNRNRRRPHGGVSSPTAAAPFRGQPSVLNDGCRFDILRPESVTSSALDSANSATLNGQDQMVTLTGTIKRGRKQDQVVEVQFEIPEKELNRLNAKTTKKEPKCSCGLNQGPHVLLFTILFTPLAFLSSIFTTFYIGTLCWYNIYLYVSEELTIFHKIFFCPLLLIAYPVIIVVSTFCLSVVAAVRQVSWRLSRWCHELHDYDKGFFVWLCNALNIPQCAPYEVVVLDEAPLSEAAETAQRDETSEDERLTRL